MESGHPNFHCRGYIPTKEELTFRGVVSKNYRLALLVIAKTSGPARHVLVFCYREWSSVFADNSCSAMMTVDAGVLISAYNFSGVISAWSTSPAFRVSTDT